MSNLIDNNENEILINYTQIFSSQYYSGYECDASILEHIKFLKIDEIDEEIYNNIFSDFTKKIPTYIKFYIFCYDPDLYCIDYKSMHEIQVLYDMYMNDVDLSNLTIMIFVEQVTEQQNLLDEYIKCNNIISPKLRETKNYLLSYLKSKNVISQNEKALKPNISKLKLIEEMERYKYYKYISYENLENILRELNISFYKKYEQIFKEQVKAKIDGIRKSRKKKDDIDNEEETTIVKDGDINRARDKKFYLGLDITYEWMSLMEEKARQIIFT